VISQKWLRFEIGINKKNYFGNQFISIQATPYIEKFAGFWILREIELISLIQFRSRIYSLQRNIFLES